MRKGILGALAAMLLMPAANAQQAPDTAALQRAIAALQAQRNQAWDVAVTLEMKAASLAEDLAKAQAKVKELEEKEKK